MTPILAWDNQRMWTCNRFEVGTLGYLSTGSAQKSPRSLHRIPVKAMGRDAHQVPYMYQLICQLICQLSTLIWPGDLRIVYSGLFQTTSTLIVPISAWTYSKFTQCYNCWMRMWYSTKQSYFMLHDVRTNYRTTVSGNSTCELRCYCII